MMRRIFLSTLLLNVLWTVTCFPVNEEAISLYNQLEKGLVLKAEDYPDTPISGQTYGAKEKAKRLMTFGWGPGGAPTGTDSQDMSQRSEKSKKLMTFGWGPGGSPTGTDSLDSGQINWVKEKAKRLMTFGWGPGGAPTGADSQDMSQRTAGKEKSKKLMTFGWGPGGAPTGADASYVDQNNGAKEKMKRLMTFGWGPGGAPTGGDSLDAGQNNGAKEKAKRLMTFGWGPGGAPTVAETAARIKACLESSRTQGGDGEKCGMSKKAEEERKVMTSHRGLSPYGSREANRYRFVTV